MRITVNNSVDIIYYRTGCFMVKIIFYKNLRFKSKNVAEFRDL